MVGTDNVASGLRYAAWWFERAGGCPAAGHFLLFGQKKVTKEKATREDRQRLGFAHLCMRSPSGSLRYSHAPAAAQLAALEQCSPTTPGHAALLGFVQGDKGVLLLRPSR